MLINSTLKPAVTVLPTPAALPNEVPSVRRKVWGQIQLPFQDLLDRLLPKTDKDTYIYV
jgi:hypothetical protein